MAELWDDLDEPGSALVRPGALVAAKYRLVEPIGSGGMSTVWRAHRVARGEQVAIKIIAPSLVRESDARRRFDREARAAAKIRSDYIVRVEESGALADGTPFLVMELLEGEPLSARIRRDGPLSEEDCIRVLVQAGRALAAAHAAATVHRDVKPQNIFLANTTEQGGFIVKVLDFGIAKILEETDSTVTRSGTMVGTPSYMSPEQARALKTLDRRTDLYSLGMVAYTMLTGRTAFAGESYGDLVLAVCTKPLPIIRDLAPRAPAAIQSWFERACAREPADRFATADDLVDAFRAAFRSTDRSPPPAPRSSPLAGSPPSARGPASESIRPSIRMGTLSTPAGSGQFRGSALYQATAWFQEKHGNAAAHAVISRLPSTMRAHVTPNAPALGILGARSYPYPFVGELVRTMRHVVRAPDEDRFVRDLTYAGLEVLVSTMHRVLLRYLVSPAMFIERRQEIWNLFHETGRVNIVSQTPTSMVVEDADWPNTDAIVCKVNLEGRRKMLELMGMQGIDLQRERCRAWGHETCVTRLRWMV
jgi:serine/threonine-protein kinase